METFFCILFSHCLTFLFCQTLLLFWFLANLLLRRFLINLFGWCPILFYTNCNRIRFHGFLIAFCQNQTAMWSIWCPYYKLLLVCIISHTRIKAVETMIFTSQIHHIKIFISPSFSKHRPIGRNIFFQTIFLTFSCTHNIIIPHIYSLTATNSITPVNNSLHLCATNLLAYFSTYISIEPYDSLSESTLISIRLPQNLHL